MSYGLFDDAREAARTMARAERRGVLIWRNERKARGSAAFFFLTPDGEDASAAATFIERVPPPQKCQQCGKLLDVDQQKELELDQTTGLYVIPGNLPRDHVSQGCFPFGRDCAAAVLASGGELVKIDKASKGRKAKGKP